MMGHVIDLRPAARPVMPESDLVGDLLLLANWPLGPSRAVPTASGPLTPSCLDGGSELVVSVSAPGVRRLGLYSRLPGVGTAASDWRWRRRTADGMTLSGRRVLFAGEQPTAWATVESITQGRVGLQELRQWHAALGPNGRIYSAAVADDGPAWVSWQLDRRIPIQRVLTALRVDGGLGLALIAAILGVKPAAPWSISLGVGTGRWRLGTSRWAFDRETREKRQRLTGVTRELGGDGPFTEAVYKLVAAGAPIGVPSRTGRAVEVELPITGTASVPLDVEFFFAAHVTPVHSNPLHTDQRQL